MSEKYTKARLVVAAVSGTVFIAEVNKAGTDMTENRREVPAGEFFKAITEYLQANYPATELVITAKGQPVARLSLIKSPEPLTATYVDSETPDHRQKKGV